MGSPELPVEDENNIDRPPVNSLPMHGINGIGGTSDDSDNENMDDAYAGYQPLAFDEDTMEYSVQMENNNEMDDDENDDYDYQVSLSLYNEKLFYLIVILYFVVICSKFCGTRSWH